VVIDAVGIIGVLPTRAGSIRAGPFAPPAEHLLHVRTAIAIMSSPALAQPPSLVGRDTLSGPRGRVTGQVWRMLRVSK
jgi:hypothetical protein